MRACLLAILAFTTSVSTCETNGSSAVCLSFDHVPNVTNVTVTKNCTLPSSTHNISTLTLKCPIDTIPFFSLRVFPNLEQLILTDCNITKLRWQSLALANKKLLIDLTNCNLSCSCDNAWIPRRYPDIPLPSPITSPNFTRCFTSFTQCPVTNLTISTSAPNGTLGAPFSVKTTISPNTTTPSILHPLPYYGWLSNWPGIDPKGEESVSSSEINLHINRLEDDHLGRIIMRCWHCPDPAFITSEILFETRARAAIAVDKAHRDTHLLKLFGYPMTDITLIVTHLESNESGGNFSSEEKRLNPINSTAFLGGSLVIDPLDRHWKVSKTLRWYEIYSHSCVFCDFYKPSGKFSFKVCDRSIKSTADDASECQEMVDNINHYPNVPSPPLLSPSTRSRWWPAIFIPLFVILALAVGRYVWRLRNKYAAAKARSNGARARRGSGGTEETRLEERTSISSSNYAHILLPSLELGAIQMHEKIGQGAFGEVFRATLSTAGDLPVAVKVIREVGERDAKEAALLSRLNHENIVRLFGTSRDADRLLLVFEMMTLGDLRTYVADRRPRPGQYTQFPPALMDEEVVNIIRQIVLGMAYLSEMGVVHRDLAARNCLVTGESDRLLCIPAHRPPITVKISDFGMSRRLYSHSEYYRIASASSVALPVRWLPPEALSTGVFNMHTDIWALGVTMWEVYSFGELPFADLTTQELLAVCMAGVRPPRPPAAPEVMYELMMRCWEKIPEERITPMQALRHEALRRPSDDLPPSTSVTESIGSAWTQASDAPLLGLRC
ncbi:hypothetical protein PMAYCL1PPCAC_01225 [Pristionchus mayeri]|uniref:Protein kinase domain-containing protein n=1 Tax=Pristionchus mayeri TaxID=1317129 RepID=A0AAN4Z4C2_9BILA|nr:hypothetical protein PMAYCL1PPCAC_01225 [Pristionchus mayeri]